MTIPVDVWINGRPRRLDVEPQHTLLEAIRAEAGLTGTKACCLVGECGACTVLLDGRSVDSCLVLALEADGRSIVTVEGLARGGEPDALQQAFLDHGAAQCGFCIPGQLLAARALLAANPRPTRADVEDGLAGNLCRCAGYEQIVEATLDAAAREAAATERSQLGSRGPSDPHPVDTASTPDARVAPQ